MSLKFTGVSARSRLPMAQRPLVEGPLDAGRYVFSTPVTAMSFFTYAASFFFAWLTMVVLLGLALKRGLRARREQSA